MSSPTRAVSSPTAGAEARADGKDDDDDADVERLLRVSAQDLVSGE